MPKRVGFAKLCWHLVNSGLHIAIAVYIRQKFQNKSRHNIL